MENKGKKVVRSALGRGLSALISTPPVSIVPSTDTTNTLANLSSSTTLPSRTAPLEQGNLAVNSSINSTISPSAASYNSSLINRTDLGKSGDTALKTSSQTGVPPSGTAISYVALELIDNSPSQPRQNFSSEELRELADSIKTLGVIQPILVRPLRDGRFEIVAGERRWRAAKLAGLSKLPVIVQHLTDQEALEIALVENVQRANLNPVEEARAYQRLADEFSLSQQEISERVGKDRTSVANYLRLLKLPAEVVTHLAEGKLSIGHAKAILSVKEPNAQLSLARKVIGEGLSVRALEAIVSRVVVLDSSKQKGRGLQSSDHEKRLKGGSFPEVIDRMRNRLGTKVLIKHHPSGRGRIEIEYFSEHELDRLVELICSNG